METAARFTKLQLRNLKHKEDEIRRAKYLETVISDAYRNVIQRATQGGLELSFYLQKYNYYSKDMDENIINKMKELFPDTIVIIRKEQGELYLNWD